MDFAPNTVQEGEFLPSVEMHEDILDDGDFDTYKIPYGKQKVLTHIIDGFVIEESDVPFPPKVACLLTYRQLSMIRKRQQEILVREKERDNSEDMENMDNTEFGSHNGEEVASATCEQCGFSGPKCRFAGPLYQFCSLVCARKYKSANTNQPYRVSKSSLSVSSGIAGKSRLRGSISTKLSKSHKDATYRAGRKSETTARQRKSYSTSGSTSESNSLSESEESVESQDSVFCCSPSPSPDPVVPYQGNRPVSPAHWSVDDVWRYIRSFPDSSHHAEDFRSQEIDGSALLLLNEEHLVESMNLPLGPALKLCAHIDRLRDQVMMKCN